MTEPNVKAGMDYWSDNTRGLPVKGKRPPVKGTDELNLIAKVIVAKLRSENLCFAQAREVLKMADELLNWEPLK